MDWIIIGLLALVLECVFGLVRRSNRRTYAEALARRSKESEPSWSREDRIGGELASRGRIYTSILVAIPVLFTLLTLVSVFHQVPYGNVGLVTQFGAIVGQTSDGLVVTAPWQGLTTANIQVQSHEFKGMNAFSAETQDVFVDAVLNVRISPENVQQLYRTVGADWFQRVVDPRVNQDFKNETVKYRSVDIAPNREAIRVTVQRALEAELAPYSIHVEGLLLRNVSFSPKFTAAIEEKQIAAQNAQAEENRIAQRTAEAQQVIETAKGTAEALKVNADGQAYANQKLAASLTPALIQWQLVQKLGDKIQVIMLPSGQGIIIDAKSLLGSTP